MLSYAAFAWLLPIFMSLFALFLNGHVFLFCLLSVISVRADRRRVATDPSAEIVFSK